MGDRIAFVDLERQISRIRAEVDAAIAAVIDTRQFIGGPFVAAFESAFSEAVGAPGVGCSSGTSALSMLLEAAGVGPGDEVITASHTFVATAEAIRHVGAMPVLVDIDPRAYTIDPDAVAAAIGPRSKAVMPVHLYGTPADMDPILEVARRHDLVVIEDAAQAHLATYHGRSVGSLADGAGFSFYPGKNLGAFGDAGFLTTTHSDWLARCRSLVDHGRRTKYEHDLIGYNHRLDAIQAAVLTVKLRHLAAWTSHRREVAAHYDSRLRPAGFKVIEPPSDTEPVYHLYVVEVSNREETMAALADAGIGCGIHYPVPLHLQRALADFGVPKRLQMTERVASRVVSLPIDSEIASDDVDEVCDIVLRVARP